MLEELADSHDLLEGIDQQFKHEAISQALSKLDQSSREVLILRFFEERSYEEIADILKRPAGTIATQINRAKQKLKRQLEETAKML